MEAVTYDPILELTSFPEVAPPPMKGTIWILGRKYILPIQKAAMMEDVRSKIWCTYRKNFRAISGTSYTSDAGWGCTLRCGQMLLAQALICNHLGREWRWRPKQDSIPYMKVLGKFLDNRDSEYSIQMIANQGADFGRPVGQWFGPNNIAQAIKKLSIHDRWSQLAVHVAMDMVVVIEDMKALCREPHEIPGRVNVTTDTGETISLGRSEETIFQQQSAPSTSYISQARKRSSTELPKFLERTERKGGSRPVLSQAMAVGKNTASSSSPLRTTPASMSVSVDYMKLSMSDFHTEVQSKPSDTADEASGGRGMSDLDWGQRRNFRSLLLFIPLRLGQDKFNSEYTDALKACLTLPQSVGIIGGKPRHALYFIGYHGNHLLYLDPHTTQPTVQVRDPTHIPDASFHCSQADRIRINELDPSLALGFFCKDEADIDNLCERLQRHVLCKMHYNMFELTEKRPVYWSPVETTSITSIREPFLLVNADSDDDSDGGFELIDFPSPPP